MPYFRLTINLMVLALAGQAQAETANQEEFPPLVQAFFGSLMLEDQSGDWKDINGEDVDVSFPSSLPSGGIEAERVATLAMVQHGYRRNTSATWFERMT